jgi:hypothetical protein
VANPKLAQLADSPAADTIRSAGSTLAFAEGGTVEGPSETDWPVISDDEIKAKGYTVGDNEPSEADTDWPVISDDEIKAKGYTVGEPSAAGAFARGAARGALPAAGGIAGAVVGGELGAAIGALPVPIAPITVPLGGLIGGIGGAMLGGAAVSKVQDYILEKLGLLDTASRTADVEAHPYAAMAGELAPNLIAFNPSTAGKLATRVLPATVGAGLEAGQEKLQGEDLDPGKIALASGAMALMNKRTRIGSALEGVGTQAAENIRGRLPAATQAAINAGQARSRAFWNPEQVPPEGRPGRPDEREETEPVAENPPDNENQYSPDYTKGADWEQGQTVEPGPEPETMYPDLGNTEGQGAAGHGFPEDMGNSIMQDNPGGTQPQQGAPAQSLGINYGKSRLPRGLKGKVANENLAGQSQPGTAPIDNVTPTPEQLGPPPQKTKEFIVTSKREATPARNNASTVGTAHAEAPPPRNSSTVGNNPDHPLSVGSARDYRATADSNVHPSSSGSGVKPSFETLEPAEANIDTAQKAAIQPDEGTQGAGAQEPDQPQKPSEIADAAVTDTVTQLRKLGMDKVADAVESRPEHAVTVRRILRDLTAPQQEGSGLVDEAKAQTARRLLERAQTEDEHTRATQMLEEAQNPGLAERRATEQERVATQKKNARAVVQNEGETITAGSETEARTARHAQNAAQAAFEKFPPPNDKVPTTLEDRAAFVKRLQDAVAHAQEENFGKHPLRPMPVKRTGPQEWLRNAYKLVFNRAGEPLEPGKVKPADVAKFIRDEVMLRRGATGREVRGMNRVDTDVAMNKRRVTTDPIDSAIGEWTKTLDPKDRAAWEREFGPAEHDASDWETENWGERSAGQKPGLDYYDAAAFLTNEDGSFNPQRLIQSIRGFLGPRRQQFAKRFMARAPSSWREEYARSVDDGLYQVRKMDDTNWLDREKEASQHSDILKEGDDVYLARERDDIASLPTDKRDAYYKELDPVFEDNDHIADQIEALAPGTLGPKVHSHTSRIPQGLHPDFGGDPVANVMATRRRGLKLSAQQTMQREFMALEDPNGNRTIVSQNDRGYSEWHNHRSVLRQNAAFDTSVGTQFRDHNNVLQTVRDALTPEIEAHANFSNGQPAKYYKSAILSAYVTNAELRGILSHLQYLESLKPDLLSRKLGTQDAAQAQAWAKKDEPWQKTVMPQMRDWYMNPRVREVFDDFAAPGFTSNAAWNAIRNLSEKVTKMLFLLPTFHIANVGAHWFVARGSLWIKPKAYKDLYETSLFSIRSVLSQDTAIVKSPLGTMMGLNSPAYRRFQDITREHGGGTQTGGVLNQNRLHNIAKAAGVAITSQPSKWDPIARVFGPEWNSADLGRAIYRASSKIMWMANDMFYTQLVAERMKGGSTMKEAITDVEKHFPNYRVPSRVISGENWGRITANALRDNTLFAFGPYHYGVFNSYAHIVKDSVQGTGEERKDAIGKMMALGILAFAVYPLWDKAAQALTGNNHSEARRRGPLALPNHVARAMEGKEDLLNVGPSSALTLSPLVGGAYDLYKNRDFAGRPFVQPGDMARMAKGPNRLQAAGRVATQGAAAGAKTFIAPYAMASKALESRSPGGALGSVRDQALDFRNPSPAAIAYEAHSPVKEAQDAAARARKGNRGWEENVYNKLTR